MLEACWEWSGENNPRNIRKHSPASDVECIFRPQQRLAAMVMKVIRGYFSTRSNLIICDQWQVYGAFSENHLKSRQLLSKMWLYFFLPDNLLRSSRKPFSSGFSENNRKITNNLVHAEFMIWIAAKNSQSIDMRESEYNQIYWEFHKWRSSNQIVYQVFPFESFFCSTFFLLSDFCNQTQKFRFFLLHSHTRICVGGHVGRKKSLKRKIFLQSEQPTTPTADVM